MIVGNENVDYLTCKCGNETYYIRRFTKLTTRNTRYEVYCLNCGKNKIIKGN